LVAPSSAEATGDGNHVPVVERVTRALDRPYGVLPPVG
jgi:hypothetical protein